MTKRKIEGKPIDWPCINCGSSDRNASGSCRACVKARNTEYRLKNPEKFKKYAADSYVKNPEKHKASAKKWADENKEKKKEQAKVRRRNDPDRYKNESRARALVYALLEKKLKKRTRSQPTTPEHREKRRALNTAWEKKNREKRRIISENRRAKKQQAGGVLSKDLAAKLMVLQKGVCPCCRQPLGADYHLDHKMPIALGGSNTDDNIQLLRSVCNRNKSSKHPVDFMQERGFLL